MSEHARPSLLAIIADVSAYNDVVIHERTRPLTVQELRASLDRMEDGDADWSALHADYARLFAKYQRDPDALAFRETRKHRNARVEAQERRKARG